jgi:hypothetical protein
MIFEANKKDDCPSHQSGRRQEMDDVRMKSLSSSDKQFLSRFTKKTGERVNGDKGNDMSYLKHYTQTPIRQSHDVFHSFLKHSCGILWKGDELYIGTFHWNSSKLIQGVVIWRNKMGINVSIMKNGSTTHVFRNDDPDFKEFSLNDLVLAVKFIDLTELYAELNAIRCKEHYKEQAKVAPQRREEAIAHCDKEWAKYRANEVRRNEFNRARA